MSNGTRKPPSREDRDTATAPQQNVPKIGLDTTAAKSSLGVPTNGQTTNDTGENLSTVVSQYDPTRITIGTNYGELVAGQSAELTFPVCARPPKSAWFRAHPENEVAILMLDLTANDSDGLYYLEIRQQGRPAIVTLRDVGDNWPSLSSAAVLAAQGEPT
jgi:hypothetical protein